MYVDSFLETALWSTCGDDCEKLDDKYSICDVSEAFKDQCQTVMNDFMGKARHLFNDDELDSSPIEHDLWLTIHGHGAGFWDGDYVNGDDLTKIAKSMPELEDDLRDDLYQSINEGE
jgi:hypothetical protein